MIENIVLFFWAVLSNTKDILVEYSSELLSSVITKQNKSKANFDDKLSQKKASRKRKKLAYFKSLKRQMGFFSPERKSKSSKDLSSTSDQQQKALNNDVNKIDSLENELMMLKMELDKLSTNKTTTTTTTGVSPSIPAPPTANIPIPPPLPMFSSNVKSSSTIPAPPANIPIPPPLPPLLPPPKELKLKSSTSSKPAQPKQAEKASLDMNEILDAAKKMRQKQATINRSPGGTPLHVPKKNGKDGFQNELFAAIKNKFKAHNEHKSPAKEETDSDSDFSPAFKKPVLNKVSETKVEKVLTYESDKENSPVKGVSAFIEKFNKNRKKAASPISNKPARGALQQINV